jgi:folylpolyglutamate synthase/dihydropteroate synthase
MCEILFPLARRIYLPKIEECQFVEPALLCEAASKLDCEAIITDSLDEALKLIKEVIITDSLGKAFTKAGADKDTDFILAAGSLHLAGEVIKYLNI